MVGERKRTGRKPCGPQGVCVARFVDIALNLPKPKATSKCERAAALED